MTGSHSRPETDRRQFLKLATSLALVSILDVASPKRAAAQAQTVDPKDPLAVSLNYACDGATAPGHVQGQFCTGCQLYSGTGDAKSGPCALFQGKLVCAGGWCKSWVKRAT